MSICMLRAPLSLAKMSDGVPLAVMITSTLRRTSSAARAGNRSFLPSDNC